MRGQTRRNMSQKMKSSRNTSGRGSGSLHKHIGRRKPVQMTEEDSEDDTAVHGLGIGSDFEDEEIDEDMAFDDDDEERYGSWFARKEEDDEIDLEEEMAQEARRIRAPVMDLSDMLDDAPFSRKASEKEQSSDEVEGEEDEDEDENSEDECSADDSDDIGDDGIHEDDSSLDSDEGESDIDEDGHDKLMAMLSRMERRDQASRNRAAEQLMKAGSGNDVAAADTGVGSGTTSAGAGVSLDELVAPLRGSSGFAQVKKSLDNVRSSRDRNTVAAPVQTSEQQQAERSVAYQKSCSKISRWTHLVKANREAEHTSFPLNAPETYHASNASLTAKFKVKIRAIFTGKFNAYDVITNRHVFVCPRQASNSLEKDLEAILDQYGMGEGNLEKTEELEMKKFDEEQAKQRHAEVSKLKSLMFYHELKAKRIKKIKSKKYRKIRKKMLEKQQGKTLSLAEMDDLDPERAAEVCSIVIMFDLGFM